MCGEANHLWWVTGAKASWKQRQSHWSDLKPGDLFMGKVKSPERGMEAWTVVVDMHSNDLRIGVKSLSNPAMAGSCWNMPSYSLVLFIGGVKYGWSSQGLMLTELFPTQKLPIALDKKQERCVRYCSETRTKETKVKVPKFMLSVSNSVRNLRQ